jgi:tRNA (guanine37-N1)-methyltransferase
MILGQRAEEALGCSISEEVVLYNVRKVAPNKEMYCLEFRLPYSFVSP